MGGVTHTDVAAYLLGLLDQGEAAAFETHLLECPHCQLDLLEFYELPEILDDVRRHWPLPPRPVSHELKRLLGRVAGARRRRRLLVVLAAAAVAVLVVVGPLITLALRSSPVGADQRAAAPVSAPPSTPVTWRSGAGTDGVNPVEAGARPDPGDHLQASVTVLGTAWGSQIALELLGATGPRRCQLFAVSWAGEAQVVTTWMVPDPAPDALRLSGGTAFTPDQIEKFEVRADDGAVLATVAR